MFARSFQLFGLRSVSVPFLRMEQAAGYMRRALTAERDHARPSSKKRPVLDEHPGPPLSHRTRGSLAGSLRDSKKY